MVAMTRYTRSRVRSTTASATWMCRKTCIGASIRSGRSVTSPSPAIADSTHPQLMRAYATVKRACAEANDELGLIDHDKARLIVAACHDSRTASSPTSSRSTCCRAAPAHRRT